MIRIIYFFIFFLFLSCEESSMGIKPKNKIEEKKMVEILTDLYIYKHGFIEKDRLEILKEIGNNQLFILRKYQISPEDFKENFNYYYLDNKQMEIIFEQIAENLKQKLSQEAQKK